MRYLCANRPWVRGLVVLAVLAGVVGCSTAPRETARASGTGAIAAGDALGLSMMESRRTLEARASADDR